MNADKEPISIDLAREADFSVGGLTIRPSLRQVETGGAPETLEPRVMQVLVALFQRRNEVVSRDELIARCWGGRIVGEDAISRCIARVRKLGEAHGAFGLETIPRVGYRLTPSGEAAELAVPKAAEPFALPLPGRFDGQALLKRREVWIAAALAVVVIAGAAVFLSRPAEPANVDAVMERLTHAMQEQTASSRDIKRAGAAVQELGASGRPEEKSAFAALANGDSNSAIDILEGLAAEHEKRGDARAAADVYTRIGALALVVDQGRGLAARRKALQLAPTSLPAFQGLFMDTMLLKGPREANILAEETLANTTLTPRMRAWVLAHRGVIEADAGADMAKATATVGEIQAIVAQSGDPVAEAVIPWVQALMALHSDNLGEARRLSEKAILVWPNLPEKLSNASEVTMVRSLYNQGDWSAAFDLGRTSLDRRGREGDLLPSPMIEIVCEAGILIDRVGDAASACQALSRRSDASYGAQAKTFSGFLAAATGDVKQAESDFGAAHALMPAGSFYGIRIMQFEAWTALKAGRTDEAEKLVADLTRMSEQARNGRGYRSYRANVLRMLGAGLISAGKPDRACAPLAEALTLYSETGGDAGRVAVEALRGAAACR